MKRILITLLSVAILATSSKAGAESNKTSGAVYTATNAVSGNQILIFNRAADGSLTPAGSVNTGGAGTGIGLGNQNGIALGADQESLFVVNAGSDEISSFAIERTGLTLVDKVWSGGRRPISIAVHHDLLYVLNAGGQFGGTDNITGFSIGDEGRLSPLAGSTRPLSAASTNPAQIGFNTKGSLLAVTEKGTNRIDIFTVDRSGVAEDPHVSPSSGPTPFGFNFGRRNQLFVSEAANSGASSYSVSENGDLRLISASVLDHQNAACWLVVGGGGRFAYAANAASASVSGYEIDSDGAISLLNADGRTGETAAGPVDEAISEDGRFLYTLDARSGAISVFGVRGDGSLEKRPDVSVPLNTNGFAAR